MVQQSGATDAAHVADILAARPVNITIGYARLSVGGSKQLAVRQATLVHPSRIEHLHFALAGHRVLQNGPACFPQPAPRTAAKGRAAPLQKGGLALLIPTKSSCDATSAASHPGVAGLGRLPYRRLQRTVVSVCAFTRDHADGQPHGRVQHHHGQTAHEGRSRSPHGSTWLRLCRG